LKEKVMANIAQVLKEEIRRLARKEIRSQTSKLKKDVVRVKKVNVALRRIVSQLQRDNELLMNSEKRRQGLPTVAPEEVKAARVTAKGIRSMRRKLGLSQAEFAKLVKVSSVAVGIWEKKGKGALRMKDKTRTALLALRGVGAREARRRLELLD
jgi:DNA-binding transcriptional regulator YiaG